MANTSFVALAPPPDNARLVPCVLVTETPMATTVVMISAVELALSSMSLAADTVELSMSARTLRGSLLSPMVFEASETETLIVALVV